MNFEIKEVISNTLINTTLLSDFYKFRINNPQFSMSEALQIFIANPSVSVCKTFDEWNLIKRRVSKGEKAISYTSDNNPYLKCYVFDIKQTYGRNYPPKTYRKRKHLVDEINNINVIKENYLFETYSNLVNVVNEYLTENDYLKENELENKFLKNYVAIFVNATFSNTLSIPFNLDLEYLPTNRRIDLISEAEKIATELSEFVLEKNVENKKEEQTLDDNERNNESIRQIRTTRTRALKNKQEGQLSLFDLDGFFTPISDGNTADSQRTEGEIVERLPESTSENIGLYGTDESTGTDDEQYRRDSDERSDLHSVINYKLSELDFVRTGGAKTKFKENIEAIKTVKLLETENRLPTENEQKTLARYVGFGGLSQAFDETNENWQKEYKELKELLTEDEYTLAKGSVLNAHYTSNIVINSMYMALDKMGLHKGKILEPATGTGNFIGLIPETFDKSEITGVEIDDLTGRIAKYLYPESDIQIKGFEETNFKNNTFDAVITNVPFGAYKVYDKDYDKYNFYIHDYFIAKSIDKIRPNGICAVITTKGTLDKASTGFRKHIADRAELIGAIRLPNNAFKESAGTDVTTDILFLKKRGTIIDSHDDWINVDFNEDGIPLNNYYLEHPDMLLGKMEMGRNMYGNETETYLVPDDRPLNIALEEAIKNLPENIYQEEIVEEIENADFLPADYYIKNFAYEIINDKIYMRIDDNMVFQSISENNIDRMKGLINLRKCVRNLLELQINNCSDEELIKEQDTLNNLYDKFTRKFGLLNSKTNRNLFKNDVDYPLLISLENYNETEKTATKTDIFFKRTIREHKRVETANNSFEALEICKNELGKVDLRYIEKLTGFDYDKIVNDLKSSIYKNPVTEQFILDDEDKRYIGWETADEYLSGNVVEKLKIAKIACQDNPIYEANVKALEENQPEYIPASDISVRLGANWIDNKYYIEFLIEKLRIPYYSQSEIKVEYNRFDGSFTVQAPSYAKYSMEANNIYGTERMNAFKVMEHCLNLQTISIYDTVEENGKEKRVLNKPQTILAREKQNKLEQEFKDWIFDNQERRNDLVEKYNLMFNNTKLQNFNGDYLTFPEMNPCIELKKHQKDAVERIITSGNTLLHHVVGAGKTFEMAAAAMKLKQYGLAHKPMIVVPNHLVMQWTREFKLLYPNANVLMATKKDLEKTNRLKFISKVATGDWDAVIIAASSFEKIPISKARQERKIRDEISSIEEAIIAAYEDSNRLTVKILEKAKKNKEAILKKLTDSTNKDDLIKFEDLGVDYLFVDEAHKYKNKFIFTKMNNVAGISRAMSNRATDLDLKCEYINELHGGNKGLVFATGTPISNSMVEMYTMQSYMQRNKLKELGMNYFDAWAANFGETQTALELAPSGNGYRTRTRFAKFTNLPELMKLYRSFADVKTADMLSLPVPKANKITITCKPSEEVLKLNEDISERAERINNGSVKPEIDNMLKITSDGKKLALDPRCYNEFAQDDEINKVNQCVNNVYNIWEKTTDKRSTQIIFCDLSTPKTLYENYNPETDFDVYNDIKYKLVQKGIPESEIRFIHEANTDLQKQTLFDLVKNGNVRVIIGSTEKCGAGTNIQNKLIALHHLDTPYRPSDLEQREGRIIRQGNSNEEVFVYTYVTERTFDSYSYQILENKQKFISQINNGSLTIREASDIDETTLSYAEIKAITTANPKIKRKMELEQELSRLKTLEGQYRNNKYYLQDQISKYLPQSIKFSDNYVTNLEDDIEIKKQNITDEICVQIGSKLYNTRKDAGDMLLAVINSQKYDNKIIGKICGFSIKPLPIDNLLENRKIALIGNGTYEVTLSDNNIGSIIKIENFLNNMEKLLEEKKNNNIELKKKLEAAKQEVNKPFEYAEKVQEMTKELSEINAELDLNKKEEIVIDDSEFKDEKTKEEIESENEEESDKKIMITKCRRTNE